MYQRSLTPSPTVRSSWVTAEDNAACPHLKAIGKQGVSIDKIDQAACAAHGIPIFNTPGANANAVTELVLALTMSVARDIPNITSRQGAGQRIPKESCNWLLLHRRTLGVNGMGNIGKTVATNFGGAFEATVIAYDPFMPPYARTT